MKTRKADSQLDSHVDLHLKSFKNIIKQNKILLVLVKKDREQGILSLDCSKIIYVFINKFQTLRLFKREKCQKSLNKRQSQFKFPFLLF